ncbi:thioredoxin family protein [Mycoplasmopsis ciconiae]|uniref:Thioredoxin family protein n=1 Tax=Mycoplasmopsis ciconiae TaxID=561067 RepID=A0ABU7MMN4_9BACT|nr:thioredoxin family protein [Mycoplasmopsis ciconiae]
MFEQLTWQEAQNKISSEKDKVLFLEFTTTWCGDCKMMKPVVESLAKSYSDNNKVEFIKIDAEEAQLFRNADNKWQILKVPTHMVIVNGEILSKGYEYYPKEILNTWVEKALSNFEE